MKQKIEIYGEKDMAALSDATKEEENSQTLQALTSTRQSNTTQWNKTELN